MYSDRSSENLGSRETIFLSIGEVGDMKMTIIFNLLGGLSEEQAKIIVAAIGLLSATVVAVIGLFGSALTIMLNKRSERRVELRKIKENQYIEFLRSLAEAKLINNDRESVNKLLSARIQTIYLIGNKEVQKALADFLDIFTKGGTSVEVQDKKYASLVKAMKKDLYGENEESLDRISFVVFKG